MRIAVVTSSYPRRQDEAGGHFVQTEVLDLVRAGHHVTVFAPSRHPGRQPGDPELCWLQGGSAFGTPGVLARLRQDPSRALGLVQFVWQVRRALRAQTFDRVIGHWVLPWAWLLVGPRAPRGKDVHGLGAPLELVVHGSELGLLLRLPRPLLRGSIAQLARAGAELRFVSQALRRDLERAFGSPLPLPCSVRPSPIDVSAVDREAARRELGLDSQEFIALIVARLVPGKRVAHALVHAPVPARARWVVIGDGPLRRELTQAWPAVTFLGELSRTRTLRWIAAADVLVSASQSEGAPTVIREARALGTPVWSSDVADVARWAEADPGISLLPELGSTAPRS